LSEVDQIFDFAVGLSKAMNKLYKRKAEIIHGNRVRGQNNPYTKRRKSESMKKYWREKREREQQEREDQKARDEYVHESCYCMNTPMPPCSFCTDSNYCEACNILTMDEECPECGKLIER